ncbi:hypothetical protein C8Q80DRAFT_1273136 [Daedaleopsis nitida]|nr:hypothetical protein C8Q80DRAFT_1273136 [Daedaleopsis nitida]
MAATLDNTNCISEYPGSEQHLCPQPGLISSEASDDMMLKTDFPTRGVWDENDPFKHWEFDVLVHASVLRHRFNLIPPDALSPQRRAIIHALLVLAWETCEAACTLDDLAPPGAADRTLASAQRKIHAATAALDLVLSDPGSTVSAHPGNNPVPNGAQSQLFDDDPDRTMVQEDDILTGVKMDSVSPVAIPTTVKIEDCTELNALEENVKGDTLQVHISRPIKVEMPSIPPFVDMPEDATSNDAPAVVPEASSMAAPLRKKHRLPASWGN